MSAVDTPAHVDTPMERQEWPFRRLLRHASHHRGRVWQATICSVLNKVFDLAPPVLIGAAIDVVVQQDQSLVARFGFDTVMSQLIVLGVLTVIVWGLESLFEYAYQVLWRNLAQALQHELRVEAYEHVQSLDMAYFEDRSTGGLMSILNDDINQLERFLDGGANAILQVATTVIVVGATFFGLAPGVAVFAFLPVPVIVWGSFLFQRRIAPRYRTVREKVAVLNGQLANNLSGVATIKSFTREADEVERIRSLSQDYRGSNSDAIRLSSAFSPLIRMAIVVGFTATLVYGGHMTQEGTLAVGAYGVLVFLTQRLLWPLTRLGETFDLYQRALASTERVLDLLAVEAQISSGERSLTPEMSRSDVRFEDVHFAYASGVPVLRGLDLEIEAGRTTAIVGATGSGKSTTVKLLLRFYDPVAGRVTIGDVDLRELDPTELRRAIGLVSQDVFLFHGTVAENVAYGKPGASEEEIWRAIETAEAGDFVRELAQGISTVVGERGQKLSGGQRQRIAIARAVLKDPPILVLDEATSSVDNETEAAIQRSFQHVARGRTSIVIAHRLSTIRDADRIYVLDAGTVAEQGTHDELIRLGGLYAQLWQVQTGERAA